MLVSLIQWIFPLFLDGTSLFTESVPSYFRGTKYWPCTASVPHITICAAEEFGWAKPPNTLWSESWRRIEYHSKDYPPVMVESGSLYRRCGSSGLSRNLPLLSDGCIRIRPVGERWPFHPSRGPAYAYLWIVVIWSFAGGILLSNLPKNSNSQPPRTPNTHDREWVIAT